MRINTRKCLDASPIVLLFALTLTLGAQSYTIVDIGALSGGNTFAARINTAGQAVGKSGKMYGVQNHAFVLASGKVTDIGTLPGGEYSAAADVNTKGSVVGESNTSNNIHAFLWQSGTLQDLGTLPGDNGSRAFGINDSDQVVGYSTGSHPPVGFLWTKDNGMTSLGTLPGGDTSVAYAINNPGSVVGSSSTQSGEKHAFLWTAKDGMQDLGTLPGDITSEARKISTTGIVIGSSIGQNVTHAFIWTAKDGMQNIGSLNGDSTSALDLNNKGEVVGTSTASMSGHAFYWSAATGIQDLNALIPANSGFILTSATAINNAGWILALGAVTTDKSEPLQLDNTHHHGGAVHAFLLKPAKGS